MDSPCFGFLVSGPDAIVVTKGVIGPRDPTQAGKDTLRGTFGNHRFDAAYFNTETFTESMNEKNLIFGMARPDNLLPSDRAGKKVFGEGSELALILISPTLVQQKEYPFIIEDFLKSKFTMASICMSHL